MAIDAELLHEAADVVGSFGDDGQRLDAWGLPWEELQKFMDDSSWRDVDASGPLREVDPLALAMGISIGVVAAHKAW